MLNILRRHLTLVVDYDPQGGITVKTTRGEVVVKEQTSPWRLLPQHPFQHKDQGAAIRENLLRPRLGVESGNHQMNESRDASKWRHPEMFIFMLLHSFHSFVKSKFRLEGLSYVNMVCPLALVIATSISRITSMPMSIS